MSIVDEIVFDEEDALAKFRGLLPSKSRQLLRTRNAIRSVAREVSQNLDILSKSDADSTSAPIDVVDFFSGCGGMSAGFQTASARLCAYRIAAAVDTDSVANCTYKANFGVTPVNVDIATLNRKSENLRRLLNLPTEGERPLVLIGCAPCQGFSSHRVNEEADERNSLFVQFGRIATALRPDAVIVENVPELFSDRYWTYVQKFNSTLRRAGYFVHCSVHNMAEFGVPQERFRALILAMRRPFNPPVGFLSRENFKTVRQAIGHLPPIIAGQRMSSDLMHITASHRQSTIDTIRAVPKDGGSRPDHVGPDCLRRAKERSGRAVYEDVYGRLWWDRPAITITAHSRNPASGRFAHPEQDRGISVREAAILQGFPSTFEFSGSLDQRFRQIGNAVPPMFAAFLAVHVLGELLSPALPKSNWKPGIQNSLGISFSRLIPALKAGFRSLDCDKVNMEKQGAVGWR